MENRTANSSISPFERCPDDILRHIFEACVTRDKQGFETAVTLSHVSRDWRTIALTTPYLWSYVSFSTLQPLEDTKEFLKRMIERTGGRGVFLVVKDLRWEQSQLLRHFDLKRITKMESLKVHFAGAPPANGASLSDLLNLSGVNPIKLDLNFDSCPGFASRLPSLFPNLQHLHIDGGNVVAILFSDPYPTIQRLSLRNLAFTPFSLLQCFRNLEVLELDTTSPGFPTAWLNAPTEVKMPHLKRLKIFGTLLIEFLRFLSCPALSELWSDVLITLPTVLIFLKKNRSIITLTAESAANKTQELAHAAPQLLHFTTLRLGKEFYSPSPGKQPLFPRLRTLTVTDLEFKSLKDLDDMIRSRCLPVDHPKSELLEGCSPLEMLGVVLLHKERIEDTILMENEFVKEARVWMKEDDTWTVRKKVYMSWSNFRVE